MLSIFFFSVLLAALVWVTINGKDAWPFSHYPMFSDSLDLSSLMVIRLALETQTGEIIWWRSRFYRYPEYVGRRLKQTYRMEQDRYSFLAPLERQKYLTEVMRLIRLEEGSLDHYRAIHIVQRTATADPTQGFAIHEQTLARIPLEAFQGIHRGN